MHAVSARSNGQSRVASSTQVKPAHAGILQRKCACGQHTIGGSNCAACAKKEETVRRRRANDEESAYEKPDVPESVRQVLSSSGQPLDTATRTLMESLLGHDFSHVRVHTDARAAESARAVNALAYTVGGDVAFAAGQYKTETAAGRGLLAHELAHVAQQDRGRASGMSLSAGAELRIGAADDTLEREADAAAKSVLAGEAVAHGSRPAAQLLQRTPDEPGRRRPGSTLPYREATELMTCMRIMGPANADYCREQVTGAQPPSPATPPPPRSSLSGRIYTPRGPNPASCLTPLCDQIQRQPVPASDEQLRRRMNDWLDRALACVRGGASASGASHYAEIQANNETELRQGVNSVLQDYNAMSQRERAGRRREFRDWMTDDCRRSKREMELEFHYNVIFENRTGSPPWGSGGAEWDSVNSALAALPAEATWTNPQLLRFRRTECHPQDVDASGACAGRGTGINRAFIFGETAPHTGEIEIFNQGLGEQPYTRSRRLQLPATAQTLRHEVGHVAIYQIPIEQRLEFFERIMGWREYSMTRLRQPVPRTGANDQQTRLCLEVITILNRQGFCDPARLTSFLNNFQNPGDRRVEHRRTYILAGGRLLSILTEQVPQGEEFSYALTNQDDYLTELYTFAVSRPELLHASLTGAQTDWLKEHVFHTPLDMNSLARNIALNDPQRTEFMVRGRMMYTWEQLEALLNSLMTGARSGRAGERVA